METLTNRRSFVTTAGSLAVTAPAVLNAKSVGPGTKAGLVIVGLGGYAKTSIEPELKNCKHVRLAGVVTGDPNGKGKEWAAAHGFPESSIYTYDTMHKMADNPDIHFVHVATPNNLHAQHVIAAAKAGKHVICEKPMATSSADCEAMIAACKKAGVLLAVNYRLHWEPNHLKAMQLTASGVIGDLAVGTYEFSWGYVRGLTGPNKDKIKKWLLDPKMAGGGALFDTGVYGIQAACYFAGKDPVSVRGFSATRHPEIFPEGVEETMTCELLFDDGFQAICRASYAHSTHICQTSGSKGTIEIRPGIRANGRPGSVFGQSGRGEPNPKAVYRQGKLIKCEQSLQQAVLLDAFAEAIRNKATTFKTPGEMGLRDVRIIEAAYKSAANNGAAVKL
jgi:glucose-fructose oxidoreductase